MLRNRKALAIAPQWYQYRRSSHDLLAWLDDIQRSVEQLPDPPEGERVKVTANTHTHGHVTINTRTHRHTTCDSVYLPQLFVSHLLHSMFSWYFYFLLSGPSFWGMKFF